jgi:hypothetical protein
MSGRRRRGFRCGGGLEVRSMSTTLRSEQARRVLVLLLDMDEALSDAEQRAAEAEARAADAEKARDEAVAVAESRGKTLTLLGTGAAK